MSTDEAVKVAVRVRPFNKREIARNAQILFDAQILFNAQIILMLR